MFFCEFDNHLDKINLIVNFEFFDNLIYMAREREKERKEERANTLFCKRRKQNPEPKGNWIAYLRIRNFS